MPKITIPPPYQGPTQGVARVEVDGVTVEACIRSVGDLYPGFIEMVLDGNGAVHRFVKLFVNGEEIDRAALDTPVAAGDEVEILALGDEIFGLCEARLQMLGIFFELHHASVEGVKRLAQTGGLARAGFQMGQAFGKAFFVGSKRVEAGTFVADVRFDLGVLRLPLGL